ncbi:hypothetical protein Egran_05635 [Elaphomyces granulatus]|uniref:Uncharacterized protein n=1 Tax=Elaphomyces granulatus TaxID=519963 RepID=A0A232LR12_9EURO|nr:hypothetical protein Egran_05635 [Elaphomyces granulatus]
MNTWLVGGNGDVKAAILLKWARIGHSDRVKGNAELYCVDEVFPAPPPMQAQHQRLRLTRREIFGPTVFPGRNASDEFFLEINLLRTVAKDALDIMHLRPA